MLDRASTQELNMRAWAVRYSNPDQARLWSQSALEQAEASQSMSGVADSLRNLAWLDAWSGSYVQALSLAARSLRLYQELGHVPGQMDTLFVLSSAHEAMNNYPSALEYAWQGLKLGHGHDYPESEAPLLNILGIIYDSIGNRDEAIFSYRETLQVIQRCVVRTEHLISLEGAANNNLALIYQGLHRFDEALPHAQKGLALLTEAQDLTGVIHALSTLGNLYYRRGDYEPALGYLQQGLDRCQLSKHEPIQVMILLDMGHVCAKQGNTNQAFACLRRALAIAEPLKTPVVLQDIHQALAMLHKQMGNFESALHHHEQFYFFHQQTFNEESDKQMRNLRVIHEVEATRREADLQHQQNLSLQAELTRHEQMVADLDAYADTVAHDIKSPLGVIIGFGEFLRDDLRDQLDPRSQNYLDSIVNYSYNMSDMVENLLNLARLRREEVIAEPVDMNIVVAAVQQRLQPLLDKRDARFQVATSLPPALGVASWIEQVWMNYLTNALHYGGSPPQITVGAAAGVAFIRYWVQDNGDGIAPEHHKKLFRKFERLDRKRSEGHGLGLSIVKTIVEKLGGQVSVDSAGVAGQGAIFSFTLPIVIHPDSMPET